VNNDADRLTPSSSDEWREWLSANHATADGVWLVYWKKATNRPSLTWSEAVDQAICFGWIDSKVTPLNESQYEQWFTRRKPTSVWSKVNQDKVTRLAEAGLLAPAGLAAIDLAKRNGSWSTLEAAFDGVAPPQLLVALDADGPQTRANFESFPPGWRRLLLERIAMAKQDATSVKRVIEIVELARTNTRGPGRPSKPT
jgi:uncharacterized protein YdeI (YjbR/CyaY-like superfamily)